MILGISVKYASGFERWSWRGKNGPDSCGDIRSTKVLGETAFSVVPSTCNGAKLLFQW
jgi:hypothetical protein